MKKGHKHGNSHNNPFSEENFNKEENNGEEMKEQDNNNEYQEPVTEEISETNEAYDKLKQDFDTLNNQYIRLAADFDNFRKRQAQERESLLKYGTEEALKKIIDVLDNFDRAKKSIDSVEDCSKVKETLDILHNQTVEALVKMGLEVIKTEGEKFDPNIHEAVMQTPSTEYPEETIINELQKGYKYSDKVLRAALVNVAVQ